LLLLARHWSFSNLGLADLVLLPCLAVLCVRPGIRWYRQGANWVPLGEVFCALHLFYYVLPCLKEQKLTAVYSLSEQTRALLALLVFLGSFLAVYNFILLKPRNWTPRMARLLRREVVPSAIWTMFGLWLLWCVVLQTGWLPDTGSALNIFRSLATAAGILAVLYLSFQIGRQALSRLESRLAMGGLAFGLLLNFAAGYLNGPVQWLAAAMMGFVLGRKQVPVLALVCCIALLSLLQLGKKEYRKEFWGERQNYVVKNVGVVESYSVWLGAGWKNLWRDERDGPNDEATKNAGLTERANMLPVLATAIKTVPDERPFLRGRTYRLLPYLMVPRIFWSGKPRGTAPTETVGLHIGITTTEATNYASIAVGPIAEAWVNFGWIGLALAGAFFGVFFGWPAEITKTLAPNQVGWLIAAIFLISAANLEHTAPEMLCSLSTSLAAGVAGLLAISRAAVAARPPGESAAI
jgi:hypothetical protein